MFTPVAIFAGSSVTPFSVADGGVVTYDGDYKIHTFTASGFFNVSSVGTEDDAFEVLLVAGGGGGGARAGAGGGAGGLIHIPSGSSWTNFSVDTYTVTIGAGGGGAIDGTYGKGLNGDDSTIGSLLTAKGGGGGAGFPYVTGDQNGNDGGSGGGFATYFTDSGAGIGEGIQVNQSGDSGTFGTGSDGGPVENVSIAGNGGGGASGIAPPTLAADPNGTKDGSNGVQISISGTPTYYAGGGGGGADCSGGSPGDDIGTGGLGGGANGATCFQDGINATANTGGGGGGGGGNYRDGGAGGSGIAIIRYKYQ